MWFFISEIHYALDALRELDFDVQTSVQDWLWLRVYVPAIIVGSAGMRERTVPGSSVSRNME